MKRFDEDYFRTHKVLHIHEKSEKNKIYVPALPLLALFSKKKIQNPDT